MADCEPRDNGGDRTLDLSQKWLRHLRETTKTTVALPCRYCKDRKVFPSDKALFQHIRDKHPSEAPRKESDRSAVETLDPIRERWVRPFPATPV
jgi:hypothetical protein